MPTIDFSTKSLKSLKIPGRGPQDTITQVDYWDRSTPGFGLRLSSTGARTWTFMTRVLRDGRMTKIRHVIGRYAERDGEPGLTLAMARMKAHEVSKLVESGGDPAQMKADAKRQQLEESRDTFLSLATAFIGHCENRLAANTVRERRRYLLGSDCAVLHPKPVVQITRRDVIDVVNQIEQRGATIAPNRALAAMQAFFGWCRQQARIDTAPTDSVKKPCRENRRARHLYGSKRFNRPSEIALAWQAFEECGEDGALPKLLLLTGQRRGEVAGMRYDELLDLDGHDARWLLPGERTKNGKPHLIPLGPLAVRVIRSVERVVGCAYVMTCDGRRPRVGFSKIKRVVDAKIAAIIKRENSKRYAGQFTERWTFHDLRRTLKTGLAELRVGQEIRDALLNHSKPGMDSVYDHSELDAAKREAILKWEDHIERLVTSEGETHRLDAQSNLVCNA
jgi:integrase